MSVKSYTPGGVREMVVIALPMAVSFACDTVMIFTDRIFLSRLGPQWMNGAMVGGLTSFLMISFFIGLIGYITALTAQYLGAQKKEMCPIVVAQGLMIILAAYPFILAARPLAYQFFHAMGISAEQAGPAREYFDILVYGAVVVLARTCLSSFFSGIGRTRIVMLASLSAMIMNVLASYVLIFGKFGTPAFGIKGAAFGSILGSACGVLIMTVCYARRAHWAEFAIKNSFVLDRQVMKKLLRFGYPTGVEMFFSVLAFDVLVMAFHSRGAATATAATIMFNWDLVTFIPLLGVEVGVTSLVGRYMGAGQPAIAHRSAMSGIKFGIGYSLVIFVLFVGVPGALVDLFRPEMNTEVFVQARPVAISMLRFASLYVCVMAVFIALIGALRGAGDTFWAMCYSVSLHWALTIIAIFSLQVMGASAEQAWLAVVLTFLICSGIAFYRYYQGGWKTIRVIDPA
ncbi:MAG TPA: MATE family efflux transporter [Candidatus Omnitrophota bacterium]|nr:MATE family efflux transporter [Candidatus Omnitrophota bacterium]